VKPRVARGLRADEEELPAIGALMTKNMQTLLGHQRSCSRLIKTGHSHYQHLIHYSRPRSPLRCVDEGGLGRLYHDSVPQLINEHSSKQPA
jgi:hypothetical protein